MSTLRTNLDERIASSPRFHHETVAEYFRDSALRWWKPDKAQHREQDEAIAGFLARIEASNVVELGAGFGRVSKLLDRLPEAELTLVDINNKAVRRLRREFPGRQVIQAKIEEFDYPKAPYDLAVSIGVMVHIPDLPKLMRDIRRNLCCRGHWITSLTPDSWYEDQGIKKNVIHRGINELEFDKMIAGKFEIVDGHRSENGQLVTMLLKKL